MAPLVRIVTQYLLGWSQTANNLHAGTGPGKPLTPCHHPSSTETEAIQPFAPLTRSSISISAISWGPGRNDVFGSATFTGNLSHKFWDGSQWKPSAVDLETFGGEYSNPPTAVTWGYDRLDIFATGFDGNLLHKYWDGSRWNPPDAEFENLGGELQPSGLLAATTWGPNRLDIFGTGPDAAGHNAIWHKYWTGYEWAPSADQGLEHLGGDFVSEPAAVSWGPNRLDIFAVDASAGRELLHKFWDGTRWIGWESFGGPFASTPTVISWGKNRLDVFAVRPDGRLAHRYWDGTRWSPDDWEDLGGRFGAAVSATSWAPNRIDIVGLGADSQYHYKYWDGHQWNPSVDAWYAKKGSFASAPALVSWGPNRLDIFGVGGDAKLNHQTWYGDGWYPAVDGWEELGEPLQAF